MNYGNPVPVNEGCKRTAEITALEQHQGTYVSLFAKKKVSPENGYQCETGPLGVLISEVGTPPCRSP